LLRRLPWHLLSLSRFLLLLPYNLFCHSGQGDVIDVAKNLLALLYLISL
jgi:hypothetical protein